MSSGFADSSLLQERRKEAKQQNKKLKAVLRQEEEAQGRLQDSLKEAFQEAHSVADACQRELEELHMIQRDMSEIGGDVSCTLGDDTSGSLPTGMNNHVPEEPQKGFKMLERMRSLHKAENDKRLDLEEQQERLEALLKRKQAQSVASQDKHDKERKLVGHMEQLNNALLGFSFSEITYDDARGAIVLSGIDGSARVNAVDVALRTISVEYDKEHKLTRAMPHTALNLQSEATDAVQINDLPQLLTRVWDRLCHIADKPAGPRLSRGGA
jgi:hypothetical protein